MQSATISEGVLRFVSRTLLIKDKGHSKLAKMKYMRIGTMPDNFYTEQATRTLVSDLPTDLEVLVNDTRYLLHKFSVLPKCGLLQRLCSNSSDSENVSIELHDIPGGADAFDLCAKFCSGIVINISAHNFVPAFCAAKFLRMTESHEKGNFATKLEFFLNSCILLGWKDSIVTLQATVQLPEWSESLGIVRKCTDSIVEKILTPPEEVQWSYTYTRPDFSKKREPVPRDWWTEDVAVLDIDLFRCIITAIRSTYMLPPQLVGEALHVYAFRWLPDTTELKSAKSSASQFEETADKKRKILEIVVSLIPGDRESVSFGFLIRLLSIANYLGASSLTKSELLSRASQQFEKATVSDLLYPSTSSTDQQYCNNVDLVLSVLERFWTFWRRLSPASEENSPSFTSITNIGKLIDSYLYVVARDYNMPVSKFISLAEAVPEVARPNHDDLYRAINKYLKEHPMLSKTEKKQLCRILDCQKLSPHKRAHALKNELMPLRTVVQLLYWEQENGSNTNAHISHKLSSEANVIHRGKHAPTLGDYERKDGSVSGGEKMKKRTPDSNIPQKLMRKLVIKGEIEEVEESEKGIEIKEASTAKDLDSVKFICKQCRKSDQCHGKGKDR